MLYRHFGSKKLKWGLDPTKAQGNKLRAENPKKAVDLAVLFDIFTPP
jgi:hypothetical protein